MTTARDLTFIATDVTAGHSVPQGNLSLALAGAEAIDLLGADALTLDDERIVPGHHPATADPLLEQAASSLVRDAPYETIDDWLWRRGRALSTTYLAHLETEGLLRRERRGVSFRKDRIVLAESPERSAAAQRLASGEPVLAALAAAIEIVDAGRGGSEGGGEGEGGEYDQVTSNAPSVDDNGIDTVLAAVNGALMELEAMRQRRAIEQAAFDNIWRGN
ncbi:GPP34 family phosphoprotein [Streptomyces sp. NPDC057555]|uniref:GOLPH3/VPS74 family protein n=1 Tax=Streptomyces sp. NPDC057555 TaxID=3346166 RepID=UPI0036A3325D